MSLSASTYVRIYQVTPMSTIMDESGQPLQKSKEKLAWWKRHFEKVLNVQRVVENLKEADASQVTRKEVV